MLKSMTAFASASQSTADLDINVEVRGYNSRNLDIVFRVPREFRFLEEKMKNLINKRLKRGRIELVLKILETREDSVAYSVQTAKANALNKAINELKASLNIESEISMDTFLKTGDIIIPLDIKKDEIECWEVVKKCLSHALDGLDQMRVKEGKFLERDMLDRLESIEKIIEDVEPQADGLLVVYQKRLTERISALTKGLVELDENRITQEAALLAERSDITEELVRIKSHIKQFREIITKEESPGRKLNFMLQEFNREFTTCSSKIGNAGISHLMVDAKTTIEQIREQVQNIE